MLSDLKARLDELAISTDDLAAIVKRDPAEVEKWIESGPDAEGAILLRFLTDDADALRRVDQLRRTYTGNLTGDRHDGIEVPYGGDTEKTTGGSPQ